MSERIERIAESRESDSSSPFDIHSPAEISSLLTAGEKSDFLRRITLLAEQLKRGTTDTGDLKSEITSQSITGSDSLPPTLELLERKRAPLAWTPPVLSKDVNTEAGNLHASENPEGSTSQEEVSVNAPNFDSLLDRLVLKLDGGREDDSSELEKGLSAIETVHDGHELFPLLDSFVERLEPGLKRLDLSLERGSSTALQNDDKVEPPAALALEKVSEKSVLRDAVEHDHGFHGTKALLEEKKSETLIVSEPSREEVEGSSAEDQLERENSKQTDVPGERESSELDPLLELLEKENWESLREKSEQLLGHASPGKRSLVEILWITSQVHLEGVPIRLLSAPLDSLLLKDPRTFAFSPKEQELFDSLLGDGLQRVSERLAAQKEYPLAVKFAEKAASLDSQKKVSLFRLLESERDALLELPEYERSKSAGLRLDEVLTKLETLTLAISPGGAPVLPERKPEESVVREESPATAAQARSETVAQGKEKKISRVFRPQLWQGLLLVALGSTLYLGAELFETAPAAVLPEPLALEKPDLELEAQASRRMVALDISALWYDYAAKNGVDTGDSGQSFERGQIRPVENHPSSKENLGELHRETFRKEKETVNTSSPVEPSNFPRAEFYNGRTSPERDLSPLGDIANGGSLARAQEGAGVFEILSATNVMDRPSYTAAAVARLQAGDRVRVQGVSGEWLQLQSVRGSTGFILRQDAVRFGSSR